MFKKKETKKEQVAEPKAKPAAAAAAAADAIIKAMPDALLVLDLNGVIVNVNPAYTKMLGYKPEERVGKSFTELRESLKPEDIERFMKLLGELIETGHVEPVETVIRAKDDREIPIGVVYSIVKDAEGNPWNIIASLRDITELKKAEEERAKAIAMQERAAIVDAMGDGLIVTDLEGNIISLNKAMEELMAKRGVDVKKFIGKSALDLPAVRPEDVEKYVELMKEVIEKGQAGPLEVPDRAGGWNSFIVSLLKDADGNPTALFAVVRDITELRRLQEKEKEAAAAKTAADTIEAMGDGLIVTDLDGNIISVNRFMEEYLAKGGVDVKEFIGKSALELPLIRPEDIEKYVELMKEVVEKGRAGPLEARGTTGRWDSITASLLKDAEGNPTALFAVLRDITELKRLQEKEKVAAASAADKTRAEEAEKYTKELKKAYEELKTLDKMKTDFISIAAHELRTPLTPVKAYVDLIRAGKLGRITWRQKEKLELADESIDRLARLIDDMLDVSRIEARKLELIKEPFSVGEVIDIAIDTVESLRGEWREKAQLVVNVPDNLSPIYCDKTLLVKVFDNLLSNAIKYTTGPRGKITIEAKEEGRNIHVTVTDTGIGIQKKDLEKIFQKFYLVDSGTTRRYRGIGLGLSIAKGIVEAHNGKIWAESEGLGKGSTFHVVLPVMEKEK